MYGQDDEELIARQATQRAPKAAPTPGNPERAARMQAQYDQPVTKGGAKPAAAPAQPADAQSAPGFGAGLAGGVKSLVGSVALPFAAGIDAVRGGAARLVGGDPDTLPGGSDKYASAASQTISEGVDQMSEAGESLQASGRDALGVKKAEPSTVPQSSSGGLIPSAEAAVTQAAPITDKPASETTAAESAPPIAAAAPESEWQGSGIGAGRQGGEIVMRQGADGVPEFSNDPAVQAGARNPSKGGTFSVAEPGSAQLAMERFGRANEIRGGARSNELGDNGGRMTVVRDSSRTPTLQERRLAKHDAQLAQTDALRQRTAQGQQEQNRADQNSIVDRQLKATEAAQAGLALADRQRLSELQQSLLDPSLSAEQRRSLADQYRVLSGNKTENRFTVVPGGQEYDEVAGALVNRPARVINNQTGEFVDPGQTEQPATAAAASYEAGKVYTDAQGRRARWDGSKFVPV